MQDTFSIADAATHSFAVWCARGWAHDWNGDVVFTKSLDNAALFDLRQADYVACKLGGCVYDTSADRLLTMAERGR